MGTGISNRRNRMTATKKRPRTLRRWLQSTPRRTFILYPLIIILLEWLIRDGNLVINLWALPLLPWGYLQYRLSGKYRTRHGGGGPGFDIPPERIVDTGIYRWTRNPMYTGHLIFMAGLALVFQSLPAVVLLVFHFFWFHRRVLSDEAHLVELFGEDYKLYASRVKRWIPGLF